MELSNIIPLWLRDVYATIRSRPLYYMEGPLIESSQTETDAKIALNTADFEASNLFISADNIFPYLNKNMNSDLCKHYITIVIHNLPDLYWSNRQNISQEILGVDLAFKQPYPKFKDINEYPSVKLTNPLVLYQLFGNITPYNVLHIPIRYFVESLNAKKPINISLSGINTIIQLNYEQFDFWDPISESLVEHINLNPYCPP